MTVLFKAGTLPCGLNFLPHEVAADGVNGVLETETGTLGKEDCVALAAGMVGELVLLGQYDSKRALDDRERVQRLVGQPIENFALEAYEIIKQNILFFTLLNIEVRNKMFVLLNSLSGENYAQLVAKMPVITLAEIEQVHGRSESLLAVFPKRAGAG